MIAVAPPRHETNVTMTLAPFLLDSARVSIRSDPRRELAGAIAPSQDEPEDVQARPAPRPLPLRAAGIRGLRLPTRLLLPTHEAMTIATYELGVALDASHKGVHMSRLVSCAHRWSKGFDPLRPRLLLEELHRTQPTNGAVFVIRFPYHREKLAPVTGAKGLMGYEIALTGQKEGGEEHFFLDLDVPVTTLCPCSRDISQHGAHNQRSWARVRFLLDPASEPPILDDLLGRIEAEGSSELYSVLKRPDEKYVTEAAYTHPKFSEDLARDLAAGLSDLAGLTLLRIDVENLESIHAHAAFARYESVVVDVPAPFSSLTS